MKNIPIPIDADVICDGENCGKSSHIIIDPVTQAITHIVVKDSTLPESNRRIVPMGKIIATTSNSLTLSCTKEELIQMDAFTETHYIKPNNETLAMMHSIEQNEEMMLIDPLILPNMTLTTQLEYVPVEEELTPSGEIALHRGAEVRAIDGRVGRVDEFFIEPNSNRITHLIMREGHLWMTKDIAIPLSAIDKIEEEVIYLNLDQKAVELLPEITKN